MRRQSGRLEPQRPLVGAVGAQQGVLQQVGGTVQLGGDLRAAEHRQRRLEQRQRLGAVPGAAAEADRVVEPLGGDVDAVVVGGQAQIDEGMARLEVLQPRAANRP